MLDSYIGYIYTVKADAALEQVTAITGTIATADIQHCRIGPYANIKPSLEFKIKRIGRLPPALTGPVSVVVIALPIVRIDAFRVRVVVYHDLPHFDPCYAA